VACVQHSPLGQIAEQPFLMQLGNRSGECWGGPGRSAEAEEVQAWRHKKTRRRQGQMQMQREKKKKF
jgi:hypothetical protein